MLWKFPRKVFGKWKVVLFSRNSAKGCSIRHWKFPEMQTSFSNQKESVQGLVPVDIFMTRSGSLKISSCQDLFLIDTYFKNEIQS